jgi:putative ABC transport system ATP-binding protein
MRSAFVFERVQVVIGDHVALADVTTAIPAAGITVIVGPSGAGKSTLLRLCNRLEVPTSGAVRYEDDDIAALDPLVLRRQVGMVFQRATLFAGTVRDNLLVAQPQATEAQLVAALELVALTEAFLDRDGGALSGGEAQRVCLARTLVTEPSALLMDEPSSALDIDNSMLLERSARLLAERGVVIAWVTHDLAQAGRIADHTIKLEAGRVVG